MIFVVIVLSIVLRLFWLVLLSIGRGMVLLVVCGLIRWGVLGSGFSLLLGGVWMICCICCWVVCCMCWVCLVWVGLILVWLIVLFSLVVSVGVLGISLWVWLRVLVVVLRFF